MIRRLGREPVVHFLLIGLGIFVAYGWVSPARPSPARIVVSPAIVENLAREHQARWLRPPSKQELAGLVESYVRDEILYREGLALGLDRDDPVVKRRVRQKLDVIAEEQLSRAAPTDDDLAAYLSANAERFARPGTISFRQILLPETASPSDIVAVRAAATRGADPARLGRPSLLPPGGEGVSINLVARDFGVGFAAEVMKLPENDWAGPLRSGFGLHLVRVTGKTPSVVPPLDEIRAAVSREWENERRAASLRDYYRKLRERYEVVIEAAPTAPAVTR